MLSFEQISHKLPKDQLLKRDSFLNQIKNQRFPDDLIFGSLKSLGVVENKELKEFLETFDIWCVLKNNNKTGKGVILKIFYKY
jgi:hypothetical protein